MKRQSRERHEQIHLRPHNFSSAPVNFEMLKTKARALFMSNTDQHIGTRWYSALKCFGTFEIYFCLYYYLELFTFPINHRASLVVQFSPFYGLVEIKTICSIQLTTYSQPTYLIELLMHLPSCQQICMSLQANVDWTQQIVELDNMKKLKSRAMQYNL